MLRSLKPVLNLSALFLCATALLAPGLAGAQTTYKYADENGKVVYSDHAPPAGTKFTVMQANTKPTGADARLGISPPAATPVDDRAAKQNAHAQQVADAKRSYDQAVAELEAAKEPREGERQHNANGTSHLTEEYLKRIAPLEQRVEDLRVRLEQAQRT